jgi:HSP20 family protein
MFHLTPWKKGEKTGAIESRPGNYPLARLREEFESLFDRFFGAFPMTGEGFDFEHGWALDVDESDRDVVIRAEAPGFEAKDFDVEMSGNVLHIRAEKKHEEKKEEKEKGGYTEERRYARFERMVTLPEYVDRNKVEASYRNGVLEVRMPKTAEAKGKRIEVKA